MNHFLAELKSWLQSEHALSLFKAALVLLVGILAARLVSKSLRFKKLHAQQSMILRRIVSAVILTLVVLWTLRELGLDMSLLLGAAGILTVAVGFASQTTASNLISGIFLMGERPFQIGDLIRVGGKEGYVLSIDFLSVKIRTYDNLMLRIPNETMLKSEVTNLTRFPIRRVDLEIGVAYKEDLRRVRDLLFDIADSNPASLDEPKPFFLFKAYGDSALQFQFSVWTTQEQFFSLRTQLYLDIKQAFDEQGIEIPFPHLSLYAGSETRPLPVRLCRTDPDNDPVQPALAPAGDADGSDSVSVSD